MEKKLPARPNLEHLRGQAKALLSAAKSGEPQAVTAIAEHRAEPDPGSLRLSDAQHVIARKHGFSSWPKLVHYVEELAALEGTWTFATLEVDGKAMPEMAFRSSRLVLEGDRFRMISPEADYLGIFDVNVETQPHTIDIDFTEGPEEGNSSYGIYELSGDQLKICLGFTGVTRPAEFSTKPGGGHALEVLRRTDPAAEPPKAPAQDARAIVADVSRADFEVMTPEHVRLQGEWMAVEITKSGMELPTQFAQEGRRIADGTLTTVKFGPKVFMEVLSRIDASTEPIKIDYLHTSGPEQGQVQSGIMRWQGEDVQICFGEPGTERPVDFVSEPESGHTLSTWSKRKPG